MSVRKLARYPVAAALVFVAVPGCSSKENVVPVTGPPLGPVVTVVSRTQVVPPPLLDYKTTVDEQLAIQNAVERLTVECLARFGVEATPIESRREDIAAARSGAADRYGPVSLNEAAAGAAPRSQEPRKRSGGPPPDPRESELRTGQTASGQPSKLLDKFGKPVPEFGCGREGFDKLGYRPDDILVVDGLLNDSWTLMERDSRYRDIEANWSTCMKERGFDFKSRGEPSKNASELQRRLKPDVDCAQKINYVGLVNAMDVAYQKQLIAKNSATLAGVRENNKSMAAKAREVLGS